MILTGTEILNRLGSDIVINPFRVEQINPNSYNLRLGNKLLEYTSDLLSTRTDNETNEIEIIDGIILEKGKLYLAKTLEYTETRNLVPMINGRSSIARLGLFVHVTAGFGDIGFRGHWTLELYPTTDIILYAGMQICQIYYVIPGGESQIQYQGKYQDNKDVQSSLIFTELNG